MGHVLHENGTMDHDVVVKRAEFIDKSVEVRTMFSWAAPVEVLSALKIYCQISLALCSGIWEERRHLRCILHREQL